jgi:hypothetical protein
MIEPFAGSCAEPGPSELDEPLPPPQDETDVAKTQQNRKESLLATIQIL